MKKFISSNLFLKFIGIIILAIIWQVLSILIGQGSFLIPSPIEVIKYIVNILQESYIYKCILYTSYRMIVGFIISFVLAFILGLFAGNNRKIKVMFSPLITILKTIPTASLVYLFVLLSGIKNAPIYIVVLVALPINYESVCLGFESTEKEIVEASQIDGSSLINTIFKVKLPLALSYIFLGIKSSFALAFKVEIMAEVITGSTSNGLGCAIVSAQRSDPTNMTPIFAYSLIAIVIMFVVDTLFSELKNYKL